MGETTDAGARTGWRGLHQRLMAPAAGFPEEVREMFGVTFYTCLTGVILYLGYIPLFVFLGAPQVGVINVGVALILALGIVVERQGRVFGGMTVGAIAVAGHAWFTCLTVGGNAGFQLHVLLALQLGLLFTYVPLRTRLLYASAFIAAYTGLVAILADWRPWAPLAPGPERAFLLLNSALFASLTVLIAVYYAWSVRKDRLGRERALRELERQNERLREAHAELALARDAAEQASRTKSMFVANMSHELRTPLNAIIGYAELIEEEARDDEDGQLVDDVGRITSAGKHLLSLINDILDLSKIEAGRMEVEWAKVDATEIAQQVIDTVMPMAHSRGNTLRLQLEGSLPPIETDPTKLRQMLLNLLSNASKFTQDGEVTLSVGPDQFEGRPALRFEVRDSGIGVPHEKLEHIFGEFSQADESTTRQYGGTGLGLAITRHFAEMLGGDIRAESEEGEGATFQIRLPLARREADRAAAETGTAPDTRS